jgi:uncharacterized membrane protein
MTLLHFLDEHYAKMIGIITPIYAVATTNHQIEWVVKIVMLLVIVPISALLAEIFKNIGKELYDKYIKQLFNKKEN